MPERIIEEALANKVISIGDLRALSEEELMDKILSQFHKYRIYQTADGRWITQIPSNDGKQHKKKLKSREELIAFLYDFYNMKKDVTINSLWPDFMRYKESTRQSTTIEAYVKTYKSHYKNDPISSKDLRTLTIPDLEMWLSAKIKERDMDTKMFSKFVCPFSELCKWAKRQGIIEQNPFDHIDRELLGVRKCHRGQSAKKAFNSVESKDIFEKCISEFAANNDPVPLAVAFTFLTGMRSGEVVALEFDDLNGNRLFVHREERKVQGHTEDYTDTTSYRYETVEKTKGKDGSRYITLTTDALYILDLVKEYRTKNGITTKQIFGRKQRIHYRALDLKIRRLCRLCGIEEKSMHKIRCTYVSKLRDAGMSFEKIAELVGHKQISTTMNNYSFDVTPDPVNLEIMEKALNFH